MFHKVFLGISKPKRLWRGIVPRGRQGSAAPKLGQLSSIGLPPLVVNGTNQAAVRFSRMMTSLSIVTIKIVKPVIVAIAMFWLTPLFGMLQAHPKVVAPVVTVENQTVVYKSTHTSVQFKG